MRERGSSGLVTGLTIAGIALLAISLLALPDAIYWLPDALTEGGYYWTWLLEESMPVLMMLTGGIGCLFGANNVRTGRRMRKKIDNIVGDSKNMPIADIAAAVPLQLRKVLQISRGLHRRRRLWPRGLPRHAPAATWWWRAKPPRRKRNRASPKPKRPPRPRKTSTRNTSTSCAPSTTPSPDEEMSNKISRLEAVSAKIFAQAKTDPEKLPRMRKFMEYYLPTSLKLLQTYAELDAQGVEGENIRESKRRIEQTMDTLVQAFETQLDQLFQSDAMDVSADIDVMENMLRADGLTGEAPFKL